MLFVVVFFVELLLLFFTSRMLTRSLSSFFFHVTKSQTTTIHLLSILFLPGVIIHELAHMLVASVLFVPVGEIEFFPKITEHGVKLGSVAIAKTDPVRRALIGFAPVIVGLSILFGVLFYITTANSVIVTNLVASFIIFYTVFEIGNTMFSSNKDMEGTLELFGVIAFFVSLFYFTGGRINISGIEQIFSQQMVVFFQKADFFLLLPIAIDLGVWGIIKLFLK